MIRVKLLGSFVQGIGKEVELPAEKVKRVKDILERFKGRNPEIYPGNPNIIVLVNGVEAGVLKGLDTELKDGDEVVLLPAAHGGSSIICFLVQPQKNLLEVIDRIRKESGAIVQICSAECILSGRHIELVAHQTIKALKDGELLADKPEVDFLMRISLEDQINKAIKKCGYKGKPSILIIFGESSEKAEKLARQLLKVGPPSFSSPRDVMKVHGILDEGLKAYAGPDRLLSFLVEKAALLLPEKR